MGFGKLREPPNRSEVIFYFGVEKSLGFASGFLSGFEKTSGLKKIWGFEEILVSANEYISGLKKIWGRKKFEINKTSIFFPTPNSVMDVLKKFLDLLILRFANFGGC